MQKDALDINKIQAHILRQLFTHETLRFSAINTDDIPSDQLSYHLRQLTKYELIEKNPDNQYKLSVKGRSFAIRMDTPSNKLVEQGILACRILLSRQHNGQKQYLMQKRRKVPYYGYFSEPGGKIIFGEDIITSAKRSMQTETGLVCDMTICGLTHFKDIYEEQIVQDKFFFVIQATQPVGDLLPYGPTGENVWMTLSEITHNSKTHKGVMDMIAMSEGRNRWFLEATHSIEEY
jgi:ADP-ribose pyrophosphatase YjhB (NUDIX family)